MLVKRKSLIVGLISSFVIALVLVLTLVGYYLFLEIKADEFRRYYQVLLANAKAKVYSENITISKLDARIENDGPLKGKPVIEGSVSNKGTKNISGLVIKINFLDKENAAIYDLLIRPQEPSLGPSSLPQISIPYLYTSPRSVIKPGETLYFKNIIPNCPTEIFVELREGDKPKKAFGKWSGNITAQTVSLDF